MPNWTSEHIASKLSEAEIQISKELKTLVTRISLAVYSNVPTYDLPEDCIGINRITYLGDKLEGWTFQELIQQYGPIIDEDGLPAFASVGYNTSAFLTSANNQSTPTGRPDRFIYTSRGKSKIILFPFPSGDVAYNSGNLYKASVIRESVVVEYIQLAAPSGSVRVPAYYRNPLCRYYALSKLFGSEGVGQDLNASAMYKELYEIWLRKTKNFISKQYTAHEQDLGPHVAYSLPKVRLPWNYGQVVE